MNKNPDDCRECPLTTSTRRDFLVDAARALAVSFVALGLPAVAGAQLPISLTRALSRSGDTRSYPIPAADGAQIDSDEEVILVRWQDAVYAFDLSCPHQHTALRWNPESQRFQCPKHHSQYTPDGTFVTGRATRGMDRFAITRSGDNVVVDLDNEYKQDDDAAQWTAAVVRLR